MSQELKKKIYLIQAARELKIPFVSSGGRGDGKQLAAAIAMDGYNRGFHTRKCQEGSDGWIRVRKTQCSRWWTSRSSHIMKGENYRQVFHDSGAIEEGVWSVGTVMGLIDRVSSCQEVAQEIVR